LLIRPRVQYPNVSRKLVLAALLLVLAVVCVAVGSVRARRENESEMLAGLLRTFHFGVAITDKDDVVEAVNDRAEHIFGVPLPRIGADVLSERGLGAVRWSSDPSAQRVRTCDLIRDEVFEQGVDGGLRVASYADINRRRQAGESSAYYARLANRPEVWIQIAGGPIRLHGAGRLAPTRTFGVIQEVRDEQAKLLDARLGRARRRQEREGRGDFAVSDHTEMVGAARALNKSIAGDLAAAIRVDERELVRAVEVAFAGDRGANDLVNALNGLQHWVNLVLKQAFSRPRHCKAC
jgi:PAS domain-containing protein